ncbi:copper-transporting ATPase 1 [Salmo salar]|uniref:Copper-transporting ATPase 1 n=1 Tax=Salmo salar TaxID=8030 RepID=B5XFW1_SALSA|nr:copper-transporting ATPase 1 [Salmo salar]ACI69731.1 Copper-transporting ATPase 1 [Salmo salar]|eukprot:NP_001134984.1 copper-transporting ATPase 1 [Salmo salar]
MTLKVKLSSVCLGVEGMTCASCVQSIEQRIGGLPGVVHIKVSLELKNASIIFDHSHHTPESLAEAVEDMGFDSILSDTTTASVVLTETQLVPIPALLTPEAQQEALTRLAQLQAVLEVQENKDQRGVSVTFIPSLISVVQLGEVVSSMAPLLEVPTSNSPTEETLVPAPATVSAPATSSQPQLVKMRIEGMVCLSCTTTIEGKIGKLKGVEKIKGYFVIA